MQKIIHNIFIFGIFLLLFLGYFHKITAITQDLGRHLLTGEIIIATHAVPKENLFSYTHPHFPFINHHWFFEVILYFLYQQTNFIGLLLLTCCILLLSFAVLFVYAIKRSSVIAFVFTSLFYLPILFARTDVRPEIISFLLLSMYIVLLYLFREKYTKWIFLLIPLELLWVNIHIYFPIGIAVIGLFLIEEIFLTKPFLNIYHLVTNKKLQTFCIIFISCCFMTLFNPNGIKGALYPLQVFQNYGYAIEENQNVFFLEQLYPHESIHFFFITLLILCILLVAMRKKTKLIDWFLTVFFIYLGIAAIRNVPLFVFGTFLIFCTNFSFMYKKILLLLDKRFKKSMINCILYTILFLAIISQCLLLGLKTDTGFGVATGATPATDFFIKKNLHGPIFNNFDIGSYLEYRLYPKEKIFVDGRPEAYPKAFFQNEYIPMQQNEKKFTEVDKKYHFNTIFFSYTDQTSWAHNFLQFITHNPSWKIVYIDNYVIILVKNTRNNAPLIQSYAVKEETFTLPATEEKNQKNLVIYAYLFNTLGWTKQEEGIYHSILDKSSKNCEALYNLTILYMKQNNPAKNLYAQKTKTLCPQLVN